MATAIGDSDDGGLDLDNDLPDNSNEPEEPGSMDDPSPPVAIAYPQPHPPFDMVDFMHQSSSWPRDAGPAGAHQEFRTGPLSSVWTMSGSVKFFCCFRSSQKQTLV